MDGDLTVGLESLTSAAGAADQLAGKVRRCRADAVLRSAASAVPGAPAAADLESVADAWAGAVAAWAGRAERYAGHLRESAARYRERDAANARDFTPQVGSGRSRAW